jgi:hypothetical protein
MHIRRVFIASVLFAVCTALTTTAFSAQPALAQNAALQYWKAFASLPEPEEGQRYAILAALKKGEVDESLEKVLKSSKSALRELHKAAAVKECHWAFSREEGPNAIVPHLSKAREIACVACLRAMVSFQQDNAAEAIEDIDAVLTLGRHCSTDEIIISLLVDYAIEQVAIETAATSLPSLDTDQLEALAQRLEALPPQPSMFDAVVAENEMYVGWLRRLLSTEDGKTELIKLFDSMAKDAVDDIRKHSREELLEAVKQLQGFYDRLAKVIALPPDRVKQAEERLLANPGVDGPARQYALTICPAISSARMAEAKHQTLLALLKAAIAVQQDGPEALEKDACRDPFGKGPFTYTKTESGFKLQSSFVDSKGQPVSLTVGRP